MYTDYIYSVIGVIQNFGIDYHWRLSTSSCHFKEVRIYFYVSDMDRGRMEAIHYDRHAYIDI
jgi:hypothetical protein